LSDAPVFSEPAPSDPPPERGGSSTDDVVPDGDGPPTGQIILPAGSPGTDAAVGPADGSRDGAGGDGRTSPVDDGRVGEPVGEARDTGGDPAGHRAVLGSSTPASSPAAADSDDRMLLPLTTTASLVGAYRWVENALFKMLGDWVTDTPVAAVQVHLDGQSLRHAWHAELWADRLPAVAGFDPEAFTVPSAQSAVAVAFLTGEPLGPSDPSGDDLEELGDEAARPGVLPRLAGLYRVVLPRLVTTYGRHVRAVTGSAADGPVVRALTLVLNDEIDDWHAGERLVQRLVTRPHDVGAVHDYLQRLEAAVVVAGAGSGLVSLPESIPES
jgi:hypothetical protein